MKLFILFILLTARATEERPYRNELICKNNPENKLEKLTSAKASANYLNHKNGIEYEKLIKMQKITKYEESLVKQSDFRVESVELTDIGFKVKVRSAEEFSEPLKTALRTIFEDQIPLQDTIIKTKQFEGRQKKLAQKKSEEKQNKLKLPDSGMYCFKPKNSTSFLKIYKNISKEEDEIVGKLVASEYVKIVKVEKLRALIRGKIENGGWVTMGMVKGGVITYVPGFEDNVKSKSETDEKMQKEPLNPQKSESKERNEKQRKEENSSSDNESSVSVSESESSGSDSENEENGQVNKAEIEGRKNAKLPENEDKNEKPDISEENEKNGKGCKDSEIREIENENDPKAENDEKLETIKGNPAPKPEPTAKTERKAIPIWGWVCIALSIVLFFVSIAGLCGYFDDCCSGPDMDFDESLKMKAISNVSHELRMPRDLKIDVDQNDFGTLSSLFTDEDLQKVQDDICGIRSMQKELKSFETENVTEKEAENSDTETGLDEFLKSELEKSQSEKIPESEDAARQEAGEAFLKIDSEKGKNEKSSTEIQQNLNTSGNAQDIL